MLELIETQKPDITLCQETKLDASVLSTEAFPDSFCVFRHDRNLAGGGVCIAVKKNLQAIHCHELTSDLEAVWISLLTTDHVPAYICSLYRPPDKAPEYIESLRRPLEEIYKKHTSRPPLVIIAGDINYPRIDWSTVSAPTPSDGGHFIDIVNDFYLHQLVNVPTRICNTTSSLLDLVLTSNLTLVSNLTIGGEFSDHCLVKLDLLLSPVFCEMQIQTSESFSFH
jgi:hypothetical protein